MKNKYFKIALAISILAVTSCKKLIEIPSAPPSQIVGAQVFADSSSIIGAIAGVYDYSALQTGGFGFHDAAIEIQTGLAGDELLNNYPYGNTIPAFYTNTLTSLNTSVGTIWTDSYAGSALFQINDNLEGLKNTNAISAQLKNQLIGEMKVLRAFYYFNLVNIYGAVPLVVSTDYTVNAKLPRATTDAVYKQITTDLSDAVKDLTPAYPSEGTARINLYAALFLQAKVALYQQQWQNAFNAADKVISSGTYTLASDPSQVFLDGSTEAIWQLPLAGPYYQTAEAKLFFPSYSGSAP